jgi:hypothetical protein
LAYCVVVCHKIAFHYYPLDLNAATNPFLVSWWPLALGDPALFNISLQAACLDEELLAQKGFHTSELLMADSVALLRRKVQDASLAVQDGTMNSVITLATIEVRLQVWVFRIWKEAAHTSRNILVWQGQYQSCRNARRRSETAGRLEGGY